MATPKQNYARQYQAYAQGIEPDIPASVRTYSIFNPDTGTWQRMTNGFRSPIPAQGQTLIPTQTPGIMLRPRTQVLPITPEQEQAAIEAGLARARATQGTTYQPLLQASAQIPSGGSRRRSPASRGGTVVVPMDQPKAEAPAGSQRVPAGNPYMGYAESRREFEDPDAFLHEVPRGTAGAQGYRTPSVFVTQKEVPAEVQQMFQHSGIPQFDVDKADRPFLGHERDMLAQGFYRASNLANQGFQTYLSSAIAGPLLNLGRGVLVGRAAQSAVPTANGSLAGFVDSLNVANTPATKALKVQEMRDIMNASRASKPIGVGRGASVSDIEAATNFSPAQSPWTSPQGTVINRVVGTPSGSTYVEKLALDAPVYPRYAYPPKPAFRATTVSKADVNRASQAAENALKGRYSNVGGGLSAGKVVPRATVRLDTGDTSSIWANAGRGFQRYQTLQGNPRAFDPVPSTLQQVYNSRLGIPSIGFLAR